jgi:hypothetical protein
VGGGYGQYSYKNTVQDSDGDVGVYDDRHPNGDHLTKRRFLVQHSYAEILAGYYLRLGALTAKAFAGASMSNERHLIKDRKNDHNDGTDYGFKGALELWLNMSDATWTSLDLSYTTARDESVVRWRAGWRVVPHVSIGPEFRYDKNTETDDVAWDPDVEHNVQYDWDGRIGMFARYDWSGGEVSLAGGWFGRIDDWRAADISPYCTLNVLFQF